MFSLSQNATYEPAWWFFCYCPNNHMRILMWREEKQHMIWTLRGETNVSLLKARAILSLPTLLLEGSSDHRSHCSPMTRITQQITVWTEMFFSFPSQSLLCTADNQTQQMMEKKKKTISCLRMYTSVVGEYWPPIFFQHKNKSPEQHFLSVCSLLPSSHFNSALNPLRQEKLC